MSQFVDQSDIPFVSAADLRVTYKMLMARLDADEPDAETLDQALRETEQDYWQAAQSDVCHKSAVIIRLRAVVEVCQSRRIKVLLSQHQPVLDAILAAAASERLNAIRGFNPLRLSWAAGQVNVQQQFYSKAA